MCNFADAAAVLTDPSETDQFIIGDRVWVGGTKPGSISFIGETKFAPGEWAGVTLDQYIGESICSTKCLQIHRFWSIVYISGLVQKQILLHHFIDD